MNRNSAEKLKTEAAKRKTRQPEDALRMAIIQDAIKCFLKLDESSRQWQIDKEWIEANEPDNYFSFHSISELMGVDPDRLREKLWKERLERKKQGKNSQPNQS